MLDNVNVIGQGYIGLPTSLMLAAHGVRVTGTDYNKNLIDTLQKGQLTFEEDGMAELFEAARKNGIAFSGEYLKTGVYIVSVPTPYLKESKKLDPRYVVAAINSVLDVCLPGAVIIIESTISPGSINKFVRPEIERRGLVAGRDVHLVHAPERIIPGNMIYELVHNSRTIGADSPEIGEEVRELYSSFCKGEIVITDIRTAEMTKVVENTFRDINIAYANELARICRSDDMDVYEIIRIANKHPRVKILQPGPGVGGHCISVDPWFLVGDYPGLANIILAARKINDDMPRFVTERVSQIMKENNLRDAHRVGLYGLTYKENIDDVRESPTLQMLEHLENSLAGGLLQAYDPFVKRDIVPNQHHSLDTFLSAVDMVVIMVGHDEIRQNMERLQGKVIFDTRNICGIPGTYKL